MEGQDNRTTYLHLAWLLKSFEDYFQGKDTCYDPGFKYFPKALLSTYKAIVVPVYKTTQMRAQSTKESHQERIKDFFIKN